jgi:hypothetical protein
VRKDSDWIRATVFLSATLKDRATKEVQRQTKPGQDGRKKGSLASAIAALVSAKYSG